MMAFQYLRGIFLIQRKEDFLCELSSVIENSLRRITTPRVTLVGMRTFHRSSLSKQFAAVTITAQGGK